VSKSIQEEGEKLIGQGETIFRRDVQSAYGEQDFNLTVRRAQEVVELVLKGGLKILGVDYPRIHDVAPVFSELVKQKIGASDTGVLDRVEQSSLWLSQARASSFYFERDYNVQDARQAVQDAEFVLEAVKRLLGL
jgi:HEPN domain-containing protein